MPKNPTPPAARTRAIHRQLASNARRAAKRELTIQVDSINAAQDIAFCSVEQRSRHLFRRKLSVEELTWRAEQALAPLIGMGIVPMITVRHQALQNNKTNATVPLMRSLMDGMDALKVWLGLSRIREGFTPIPVARDPFGWKMAMARSR